MRVPQHSVNALKDNEAKYNKKGGKDAAGKGVLAPTAGDTTVNRRSELEPALINTRRELLEHFQEQVQSREAATAPKKKLTKGKKTPPKGYKPIGNPKKKITKTTFPTLAEIKEVYNDPHAVFAQAFKSS